MDYIRKRRELSGLFFESALPNEYLVPIGSRKLRPLLGGRRFRMFGLRKFMRIPASIQTLEFSTDNANVDFQGLGIEGFASWQINTEDPSTAIATLDLFDENDPMARTNTELQLICIEAVRHVIANMTIEEAHRRKEDIALALSRQLKEIEKRWGIVFHHVGIRQVKVMSANVFNDLQSEYRNKIRLESARKKMDADREIALTENKQREEMQAEAVAADRRIGLAQLEKDRSLRETDLAGQRTLAEKEHELKVTTGNLEIELKKNQETALLELAVKLASLTLEADRHRFESERLRREIEQIVSEPALAAKLLETLPQVAAAQKIEHYTVFDGEGTGSLARLVEEVLTIFRAKRGTNA